MHNVLEENYIWDLHIHTCECPKASAEFGELKKTFKEKTERVQEYVNRINSVFKNYPDLKMIAFTDHNRIDPDVRKAFDNLKTNIVVLPGVEVDCAIKYDANTSGSPKHLIFYFDDEEFDYSSHADLINNWLKDNCKPSEGVDFDSFLHFLCTKVKVSFLVSPHAMKQGKRGIVSELADEEKTTRNIDLYQGLFFCFWECASTSDIEKCKQFLEDFGRVGKIQTIHFSDSNSCDKLKKYLQQPTQYFRALPSFRGLRMVGREASRISDHKEKVDDSEKGNYFGEIKLKDGQTITLSPRLNTIIGGRGSGKSLLIDSIYYSKPDIENSKEKIDQKTKKRMKYAKENLGVSIKTMSSQPVTKDFNFNYLAQNAVYNLFDFDDGKRLSERGCFNKYFNKLGSFNRDKFKTDWVSSKQLEQPFKPADETSQTNIVSLQTKIIRTDNIGPKLNIELSAEEREAALIDEYVTLKRLAAGLNEIVPSHISGRAEYQAALNEFFKKISDITHSYNGEQLSKIGKKDIADAYKKAIDAKDEASREKTNCLNDIRNKISAECSRYIRRAIAIKRVFQMRDLVRSLKPKPKEFPVEGIDGTHFLIKTELYVQEPLEYLFGVIGDYFDGNKLKKSPLKRDKKNPKDMVKILNDYVIKGQDVLASSVSEEGMLDEIEGFKNWLVEEKSAIFIQRPNGKDYENIDDLSPGTRANYLMEFIVSEDCNIPLIIDQPEDNIDNKTIAGKLTQWFKDLKVQRQIILVTHDPNIVVNADSDNVIVCEQTSDSKFEYANYPLETEEALDSVVSILEGGKEAIEGRIGKYEPRKNGHHRENR